MRFRFKLAAASAFAVLITPAAFAQDPPAEEEVEVVGVGEVGPDHVGEEITIGGRALDVRMVRGTGVRITLPSGFLALIPETHVHLWKELDPVKRYEGRNLQITGEVMQENDQLFIGVTEPDQVEVVQRRRRRRR